MVRTALLTLWLLALGAPAALAAPGHDGGNGTYGPANDKVVTIAGFILIFGIPILILLLTMLQSSLDKRKDRRLAAAKAGAAPARERRPPRRCW